MASSSTPECRSTLVPVPLPGMAAGDDIVRVYCHSGSCTDDTDVCPVTRMPTSFLPNLHLHHIDTTTLDNIAGPYHILICTRDVDRCPLLATPLDVLDAEEEQQQQQRQQSQDQEHQPPSTREEEDESISRNHNRRGRQRHLHYLPTTFFAHDASTAAWRDFAAHRSYLDGLEEELGRFLARVAARHWTRTMTEMCRGAAGAHPAMSAAWSSLDPTSWCRLRELELLRTFSRRADFALLLRPAFLERLRARGFADRMECCRLVADELRRTARANLGRRRLLRLCRRRQGQRESRARRQRRRRGDNQISVCGLGRVVEPGTRRGGAVSVGDGRMPQIQNIGSLGLLPFDPVPMGHMERRSEEFEDGDSVEM